LNVAAGNVKAVSIAVAGLGSHAIRLSAVEKAFIGKEPTDAVFREAAATFAGAVDPTTDIHGSAEYRRDLAKTLIYRALCDARDRRG
jgi:aerobic carbon-monoxide dehydrogenase medium subunit